MRTLVEEQDPFKIRVFFFKICFVRRVNTFEKLFSLANLYSTLNFKYTVTDFSENRVVLREQSVFWRFFFFSFPF